jgi:hypothetical protein
MARKGGQDLKDHRVRGHKDHKGLRERKGHRVQDHKAHKASLMARRGEQVHKEPKDHKAIRATRATLEIRETRVIRAT